MSRMVIAMTRRDAELVKAVIWFCNARITSTHQVESRFTKAAGLGFEDFQTVGAGDLWAYVGGDSRHPHAGGDRGVARDLLADVIGFDALTAERRAVLLDALRRKVKEKMHIVPTVTATARRVHFELRPIWDGVEAVVYYVALLLLSDPRQRRRVGRCALDRCGTFFYDARLRGGERKAFCKESHRVAYWQEKPK